MTKDYILIILFAIPVVLMCFVIKMFFEPFGSSYAEPQDERCNKWIYWYRALSDDGAWCINYTRCPYCGTDFEGHHEWECCPKCGERVVERKGEGEC